MSWKVGHKVETVYGIGRISATNGTKSVSVVLDESLQVLTLASKACRPVPLQAADGAWWRPATTVWPGLQVMTMDSKVHTITSMTGNAWAQFKTCPCGCAMGGRQVYTLRVRAADGWTPTPKTYKPLPGSASTAPGVVPAAPPALVATTAAPSTAPAAEPAITWSIYDGVDWTSCTPISDDQAWTAYWNVWLSRLTHAHRKQLTDYTGSWFRAVNQTLRANPTTLPEPIKVAHLDAALRLMPMPRDGVVYRAGSRKFDLNITPGERFHDLGYGSASIRESFALGWGEGVVFEIRIAAGTPCAYVRSASAHPNEDELIIPRGAHYEVVSVTPKDDCPRKRGRVVVNLVGLA